MAQSAPTFTELTLEGLLVDNLNVVFTMVLMSFFPGQWFASVTIMDTSDPGGVLHIWPGKTIVSGSDVVVSGATNWKGHSGVLTVTANLSTRKVAWSFTSPDGAKTSGSGIVSQ